MFLKTHFQNCSKDPCNYKPLNNLCPVSFALMCAPPHLVFSTYSITLSVSSLQQKAMVHLVQDCFQCTRKTLLFQAETEHRLRRFKKSGKRFLDVSFCFLSSAQVIDWLVYLYLITCFICFLGSQHFLCFDFYVYLFTSVFVMCMCVCVCAHAHVIWSTCETQRTTCGSWLCSHSI